MISCGSCSGRIVRKSMICSLVRRLLSLLSSASIFTVAVTDRGRISVHTFDLLEDCGRLYFEYGVGFNQIDLDDFEEVDE